MAKEELPGFKKSKPKPPKEVPPQRDDKTFCNQRFMVHALNVLQNCQVASADADRRNVGEAMFDRWRLQTALDMIRAYVMDRLCTTFPKNDFYMPNDQEILDLLALDDDERQHFSVGHHFFIRLVAGEAPSKAPNRSENDT